MEKNLKSIGLSEKESVIYRNALQMGRFSVIGISRKTGIKRPTCYTVVDSLIERGLISKVPNSGKSLYVVEDPEVILRQQQATLKKVEKLVPELRKIKKDTSAPIVKLFHGKKGVENIYEDMLKSPNKEIYGIVSTDQIYSITGKRFLAEWTTNRKKNGVWLNVLNTNENFPYKASEAELRRVKLLPPDMNVPASFAVYGDKVAFLSSKKDDFSFIVQSQEFRDTIKTIFDYFWENK